MKDSDDEAEDDFVSSLELEHVVCSLPGPVRSIVGEAQIVMGVAAKMAVGTVFGRLGSGASKLIT